MKPVGKPDAGNPHVRFDERGEETGCATGVTTAPLLDSTSGALRLGVQAVVWLQRPCDGDGGKEAKLTEKSTK